MTTCPPCSPAPGPMSTIQSAARMVSSSCSTTISVLPKIPQPQQGLDQSAIVSLVQADARFIQDVEHTDQPGTDLGRQPDPLGFPASQRGGCAIERQVVQPDVDQEAQPFIDFFEHPLPDLGCRGR